MKMNLSVIPPASTSTIKELLVHAESLLRTLGHYLSLYHALCWLIKLPRRAVNTYRKALDWVRSLREFPQRMVEAIAADFVSRIVRTVAVIGLAALFGAALVILVAAKGSARVG
jgi:hypothetical protein